MLDTHQTSLATRCLWSLQEANPEITAIVLASISGMTLTSTVRDVDSTQRLSALTAALLLLGEHAASSLGRGEAFEVRLGLNTDVESKREPWYVSLKPVGYSAVLAVSYENTLGQQALHANIDLAIRYLAAVITRQRELPALRWQRA